MSSASQVNCHSGQKRPGTGERGVVLVLVLWILLAMSLLALSFSAAIRTEVDAARNIVQQKQAYYLTRAGISYAVYKILENESAFAQSRQRQELESVPEVLTGALSVELAGGLVEIDIKDETGKINLNMASDFLIFNLLIMVGLGEEDAVPITNAILDWRDVDDVELGPGGAENGYYQGLEPPYFAKNGSFDVSEELLLVRGITPELYYGRKGTADDGQRAEFFGLQNYFTAFTANSRKINVNAAPLQVLAALPNLDFQDAARIYEMRSGAPLADVSEILEQIPGIPTDVLTYLTTDRSSIFTLDARGRLDGSQAVSRIRCVVRIDGSGPEGYSVLYWNEANLEL